MHDSDTKDREVGEAPQGGAPFRKNKAPIRGRTSRARSALSDLSFFIYSALDSNQKPEVQLQMLRAKLLAWAALYGERAK